MIAVHDSPSFSAARIAQSAAKFKWRGASEFTTTGTLKDTDLTPRLPEIRIPVLLTGGEHDEASPDTLLSFRDALPKGEVAVLPNASHMHHLEQPDLFLAVVRDFLKRVETVESPATP
ncbi:MAG: hypothetical protein EOM10_04880 [Opitutae bacterium]|nr:hypothetical protein [Opitutae bacterium]